MFEVRHQRACNGIERAIGLALAGQIYVDDAIGVFDFVVAGEAIQHESESLVAFHVAGTLEVFIKHCTDQIL